MCICNPLHRRNEDDENDEDDADGSRKNKTCDGGKTCPCTKPASALPSHPYTVTRAGMAKHRMAGDMANLRSPDTFGMYTYNDHSAYGAAEVVENLLRDYNEARELKDRQLAWATVEGMAFFMELGAGMDMSMADDGDRMRELSEQMAIMVLDMLATLKKEDQLKSDSDYKNIGWIMTLYIDLAKTLPDQGLLDDPPTKGKAKAFKFNPGNLELYLRKYAFDAGITLPDDSEAAEDVDVAMPKPEADDPWNWAKSLAKYTKSHGMGTGKKRTIGGDYLDITTMSSAERKQASFDKKDPLSKEMIKKIKEGECLVLA
ncbi:hypothetical protein B0I35DRAFT_420681 [Stachybotrys elegans]|uniref:Uncharacterized protein n=1 Tax=Stachybotrys elegans TaxID=80388 RepID=A0A8K0WXG5_9HYPO|nr:hypothetical protein B0I35DRAFT_420681 [Stachybotrys elegans]